MKKTLAIVLGGVTVVGVGAYVYLKSKKKPKNTTQAGQSTFLTKTQNEATVAQNASLNPSNLENVISDAEKTEKENLAKAVIQQALSRPENLNTIQAIYYACNYYDAIKKYEPKYSVRLPVRAGSGGFGDSVKKTNPLNIIEHIKQYWVKIGRPAGHKIDPNITNKDETPVTLDNNQAIIYLAKYPDLQKAYMSKNGVDLDGAKKHWVEHGRSEVRTLDIVL